MPLNKIRITRGKFFATGKTFNIIDDWTVRANAHRLLEGSWIGATDFREVAEYVDDDSVEEKERKEEERLERREDQQSAEEGELLESRAAETSYPQGIEHFELSPSKDAQPDALHSAAPKTTASAKESRVPPAQTSDGHGRQGARGLCSIVAFRPPSPSPQGREFEGECQTNATDGLFSSSQTGTGQTRTEGSHVRAAPRASLKCVWGK